MKTFKNYLNAKTLSVDELAKKHEVTPAYIQHQLTQGIKIEHEHTTHNDIAREIALDHLGEDPKYYEKLKKVEG